MHSTANARLTGTPVPFHRQMTTGCCRKDLAPFAVTGACRGHTENSIPIQRVPETRDCPATRVVALWPSAQCGALRGATILVPAQTITLLLISMPRAYGRATGLCGVLDAIPAPRALCYIQPRRPGERALKVMLRLSASYPYAGIRMVVRSIRTRRAATSPAPPSRFHDTFKRFWQFVKTFDAPYDGENLKKMGPG